jgi:hypothetical protein
MRFFVATLVAFVLTASLASAQTTASDDFNASLSGNWTNWTNGCVTTMGVVVDTVVSDYNGCFYSGASFANDQYSQATLTGVQEYPGVGVRMSSCSGGCGYGLFIDFDGAFCEVQKITNGAFVATISGTDCSSAPWAAGDVARLEVIGSSFVIKRNGVVVTSGGSDSTYTSGAPGIMTFANGLPDETPVTGRNLDDWSGGDITATVQNRDLLLDVGQ